MDLDLQDDLWNYAGSDLYDENEYGAEQKEEGDDDDGEEEYDEREGEEPLIGGEEEIEFTPDFKQRQQLSYERRSTLGTVGLSAGLEKAQRTPEEATIDQVQGVLSSSYPNLVESRKQKIISIVEKTKNVYLMNVETFVLAALWIAEGHTLDKNSFQAFYTKYKGSNEVDQVDLLRYIRMLNVK